MAAAGREALVELLNGYRRTQLIYVAALLGIADILDERPMRGTDLADQVSDRRGEPVHRAAFDRMMRGLVVLGVVTEHGDGCFSLGPLGSFLCSDGDDSLRLTAIECGEVYYPAWGALRHTLRTGLPAFPSVFGMTAWEYRARRPDLSAAFNQRMAYGTRRCARALLAAYDFSSIGTLADIGGGNGTLLAVLLAAHPGLRGLLFDTPHVVTTARSVLEGAGVADRCQVVAGSFFERVPEGADAYVLKLIVHDWDDHDATEILRACRRAMPPDGRLLLIERLVASRALYNPEAVDADLTMLVQLGGRERTGSEFEWLLRAAGFRPTRAVPMDSPFTLMEAVPDSAT